MMGRFGRRCAILGLLSATVALAGGRLWAQEDDGPNIAGGQMVRGTVTTAAGDRIAIKTDKGELFQVTVSNNTRIMKERQPVKVAEIRPGDTVGAMGVLDAPAKTVHALFVMVMDAEQVKRAREGLGKVFIAGKVTAIDELKLTVLRPDGVSQVIAVDEGTSFRRGGRQMQSAIEGGGPTGNGADRPGPGVESITLADIKVGDSVAGKGELKSGTFVPSELGVVDAAARRRRRAEGGGAGAAAAPTPR